MLGVGLNTAYVVPSRQRVIVRMGHTLGGHAHAKVQDQVLKGIVGALGSP